MLASHQTKRVQSTPPLGRPHPNPMTTGTNPPRQHCIPVSTRKTHTSCSTGMRRSHPSNATKQDSNSPRCCRSRSTERKCLGEILAASSRPTCKRRAPHYDDQNRGQEDTPASEDIYPTYALSEDVAREWQSEQMRPGRCCGLPDGVRASAGPWLRARPSSSLSSGRHTRGLLAQSA